MKLKPGDTVRVIGERGPGESPVDSDQHAQRFAGKTNRWIQELESGRVTIGEAKSRQDKGHGAGIVANGRPGEFYRKVDSFDIFG